MTNELPAIGSVWGVPGDTSTWMQIRHKSEGVFGRRFDGSQDALHNYSPDRLGLVRIDNDDAAIRRQFDCAVKSASVDVKAMRLLSQFGHDVVASMSLAGQYNLKDLAYAAVLVSDHFFQQQQADLSQPFTVDWLCEIGGRKVRDGNQFSVSFGFGNPLKYWAGENYWTLRGMILPSTAKITTRGDVLKWLDVLGIEGKKGGDE